jgi:hypothetical protein
MTRSDQLGSLPAFAPKRLATTARFCLDLAVVPFLLRALFEVNPKTLQAEIGPHATRSVAFFLAACRGLGGVIALPTLYIVFQETQTDLAHQRTRTFILTFRHP